MAHQLDDFFPFETDGSVRKQNVREFASPRESISAAQRPTQAVIDIVSVEQLCHVFASRN